MKTEVGLSAKEVTEKISKLFKIEVVSFRFMS